VAVPAVAVPALADDPPPMAPRPPPCPAAMAKLLAANVAISAIENLRVDFMMIPFSEYINN
jgi:hypothetical protein